MSTLDPAGPSAAAIASVWWWMLGVAALVTFGVIGLWLIAMSRGARAVGAGFRGADDDGAAHEAPRGAADDDGPEREQVDHDDPDRRLAYDRADLRSRARGERSRDEAAHARGPHAARDPSERSGGRWIVGGGMLLPGLAIVALLVFGTPAGRHQLPWPLAAGSPAPLRIEVIGHQWWWELRYPDSGVRLQNELRLPVGRPVDVHTRSADVIHSFWVPRLGGKLDALPGRTLVVRLQADRPGTYLGACAEFCGRDHAHMTMTVLAMEPAEFDAWLAAQASLLQPAVQGGAR